MKIGGKAQLTCPSEVAYGDSGRPPTIPGGATLIFDIELLEITKADAPKPADASKPGEPAKPADAAQAAKQAPAAKPAAAPKPAGH